MIVNGILQVTSLRLDQQFKKLPPDQLRGKRFVYSLLEDILPETCSPQVIEILCKTIGQLYFEEHKKDYLDQLELKR